MNALLTKLAAELKTARDRAKYSSPEEYFRLSAEIAQIEAMIARRS